MHVDVVPVRFGFSKPTAVLPRHRTYYQRIATLCFSDGTVADALDVVCGETVPVAAERSLSFESVAELLGGAFPEDADRILIDMGGPEEKDVTRPSALMGVVLAVDTLRQRNPQAAVTILLPFEISPDDVVLPSLKRLVAHPAVRVITNEGTVSGSYFESIDGADGQIGAQVRTWAADARVDPLDGLRGKLIRRVGQYQLPGNEAIIRRLYDGSRAFGEIYELATRRLQDFAATGGGSVAYDVRHSHWFRGPIEAALRDVRLLADSWSLEDPTDVIRLGETGLLLLPIIRTGTSLGKLIAPILDGKRTTPRIWSLLSTQGAVPRDGTRRISIAGTRQRFVQAEYSLFVDAGDSAPDIAFWQTAPIESLSPATEPPGEMLSADSMWGMIFQAGLTVETPVPKHRKSIGFTPDFGEIAEDNGPFIASKVEGLLENVFAGDLPPSIGFLCPDEPNAKKVAESLRNLAGHDTIFVGRNLIDWKSADGGRLHATALKRVERELAIVREKLSAWRDLVRRVSESERPQIVLLDEFNLTGRTFRGLHKLAAEFDLPVLCTMSLVSYWDDPRGLDIPHLTLYRMGRVH